MKLDETPACLYMEQAEDKLSPVNKDSLILFIKRYDPEQHQLNYIGSVIAQNNDTTEELRHKICKLLGMDPDSDLDMVEEVKPDMLEAFAPNTTLEAKGLKIGDIVVVQEPPTTEQMYVFLQFFAFLVDSSFFFL